MESSTPLAESVKFRSSADVYDWISGFINMERGQDIHGFRLDRMRILAELTGSPENCAPAIHVAGSKGKGTVTGMTAAILNAAGIDCSMYASPHVTDFRERISMGAKFFKENIYTSAGGELCGMTDSLLRSKDPKFFLFTGEKTNGEEPTFFELMTLWYFLCSRAAGVKAMAVETGMGGRLDATNILDPLVSVITLIELEHTEYLGTTIPAIAGEKAGIIKPGRPAIIAAQKNEALEVFKNKAAQTNSRLLYFPEWSRIYNQEINKNGTSFSLKLKNPAGKNDLFYNDLRLSIPGKIAAENAGLAILAVKTAFPQVQEDAVKKGLAGFTIPARFEQLPIEQDFILDGAHTPRSAESTISTFVQLYGKGGILIFACAANKDAGSIAQFCIPWFSKIIITTPGTFKKSFPQEVYEAFLKAAAEYGNRDPNKQEPINRDPQILLIPETAAAIKKALEMGQDLRLPILGTGSFYLAGEIKNFFNKN
ncbi:MAG: Mur ligase family protein [Treponema sp.]|nr:Mur ligase family protein [Treponema sp.]